ncbi:hypothetical protein LTR72_000573 [Exophiala xenobiotica]|nr:hypothetical protein LTR72_000573 [Exophiala xenobiotica]KAK5299906.1 hypothetical protein LTR14_002121 [Exophiala xenobiotica]KAK5324097.1 hypothetical protein LTR93_004884 [Exophiala xenobiotica]KAK5411103.1 hypothetical protein LTR06_005993 [Exophiala xenobiotica]KAK5499252.1 hypothetical protein LTR55_000074 [Exophiala xenobiotica]
MADTYKDVPVRNVDISSPFWAHMRECSRQKTIPAIIKAQKLSGHWQCLTWKEGDDHEIHPFWDSDIYKTTEAACYQLMTKDDPEMRANVEEAVDMTRAAQHPDGYLNSYYTVNGIKNRWTNLRDMHELYCLGHLFECCVAYETLTGSGRLLEPVMKAVRHIDSVFGSESGKKRGYPGHQEIEIGLLRLYEMTGDPLLLKVASYFIHERGTRDSNGETYFDHEAKARGEKYTEHFHMKPWYRFPRDYAYQQADCPLTETTEVQGHAVRAMYYYIAATDLFRLKGEKDIKTALDRLWRDLVDTKLYVTGGIGSIRQWEGFGPRYFLGDTEEGGICYSETCACFALIMWCQRMLRVDLRSEYAEVMEVGLYNGFLGAVNGDGDAFYYEDVLRTFTGRPKERSRWFEVACCPPNVAKLLGCMGSLIYSFKDDMVAIHLYIESTLRVPDTDIVITQKSNLPWSGDVEIKVQGTTALALRIPSWADDYKCSVSGEVRNGYLYLPASKDAEITLTFTMKPRKVFANPKTGKNEVCIMRGPLVYCIEDVDNDVDVDNVFVTPTEFKEGKATSIASVQDVVPVIARGKEITNSNNVPLYGQKAWEFGDEKELTFIPYFLRANRGGKGGMRVWCPKLS